MSYEKRKKSKRNSKEKRIKTLVIGDAHASPGHSNERFIALGNYIVAHEFDNVVQIGDWGSYDSLSFHDRGNLRVREGSRLIDDLSMSMDAYQVMMAPIRKLQAYQKSIRKKQFVFKGYWFESNHEYRTHRFVDENPVLEGLVPENDLVGASNDGWEIIPWKSVIYIGGICFCHIPVNDGNNQPIGGKYVARRAADLHQSTVVFGHTHRFAVEPLARNGPDGPIFIEGINVGWFGDYTPEYIDGHMGTSHWWSGLVTLHHIEEGRVDIERISIDRLKQNYL